MKKYLQMAALGLTLAIAGCQATAVDSQTLTQLELKNPKQAIAGIVSGGQPTKADLNTLAQKGVKTVINLRTAGEFDGYDEAKAATELGMSYSQLEISGKSGLTKENAQKLDQLLKNSEGPVLLHCGSGNRVGALLALRAFYFEGKSADEAIELGKAAGMTRLTTKVEGLIK